MLIPRLRAPVVLVHGLLGFGELRLWPLRVCFFSGIPQALRAAGNRVLVPNLSPTRDVATRACQLKAFLDSEVPHEPVHILAHSMGGLDSRYLISRLGMAHRVLTLTTLGTPHRGSPFADWGLRRFARILGPVFNFLHVPSQAFYDLTLERCREFNQLTPDAPGVRYFSVAGDFRRRWMAPEWHLSGRVLEKVEGPNDGVVSIASAQYGESCTIWDGDHLNLVNWARSWIPGRSQKERLDDYVLLLRRLADEGF